MHSASRYSLVFAGYEAHMCTNTQCCSALTQGTTCHEIWVENDQLSFLEASTRHNPSDSMTTQTDRTEFCEHSAFCMGRIIPAHMKRKQAQATHGTQGALRFHPWSASN